MPDHKATPKNLPDVLAKLTAFLLDGDAAWKKESCKTVNRWCDELLAEDAFGTEGQCDPRGDQRD